MTTGSAATEALEEVLMNDVATLMSEFALEFYRYQ